MYQADQQQQLTADQMLKGKTDLAKSQSDLLASQYKKRRSNETLLGQGSQASQAMADQGTVLTSNPTTRSLLGG